MSETKEFRTLAVGSASSGTMLTHGLSIGDIQAVAEWALGHPVWTHELADKELWIRLSEAIRAHLPDMPEPIEGDDKPDWKALAASLVEQYGETVSLPRGSQERTEGPMESLQRIAPGKPVIGVVVPE